MNCVLVRLEEEGGGEGGGVVVWTWIDFATN